MKIATQKGEHSWKCT